MSSGVKPIPEKYDPRHMTPVRDYIKAHFGVTHEDEIQVWGPPEQAKHAWQTGTEHNVKATFTFQGDVCAAVESEQQVQRIRFGDLPPDQVDRNPNPFNRDLCVSGIYSMTALSGSSTYPVFTTYRSSYMHPAFEAAMEQQNREQVALGGIAGTVMHLPPSPGPEGSEQDLGTRIINQGDYKFMYPDVIRTLANITPSNLMNGIVMIPRPVCIQAYHEKAFPVYRPQEADLDESEAMDDKLLFWYFVPTNHVLAWPLNVAPEHRVKQRFNVLEYRYRARKSHGGQVHVLGLLVCNNTLNRARNSFLARMLGRAYLSDLRDLDLQMIPNFRQRGKDPAQDTLIKRDNVCHHGVATIRVLIGYYLFETLTPEQQRTLCPTLAPGFPVCTAPIMPVQFAPVAAPEDIVDEDE